MDLLTALQSRAARVAVGPSTVRGLGVSGVVRAAQDHLRTVSLDVFGTSDEHSFVSALDQHTEALRSALPRGAKHWGVARKVLNIFLRDCLYTSYLRDAYALASSEALFELPLDSITVKTLCAARKPDVLPTWQGVKHLKRGTNRLYQGEASKVAAEVGVARVHLDAYWWSAGRDATAV